MPDFLLDTRPAERRPSIDAEPLFRWTQGIQSRTIDRPEFRMVLTWVDPEDLWSPWTMPEGSMSAVVGFLALDETEWAAGEKRHEPGGQGGLAARVAWQRFRTLGPSGWDDLSGNAAILLVDAPAGQLHLRTDPTGCFPVFGCCHEGYWIWASHPDILALVTGRSHQLDEVSLAEFLMASTVTPPHTYYRGIEFCPPGSVFTWDFRARKLSCRRYFSLEYRHEPGTQEADLVVALAAAWRRAVHRRSLPRLGRIAVALSGGLDSRLVLASLAEPRNVLAFTCYDRPNRELATAGALAKAARVEFLPIRRSPDYYAAHAPAGVRISGGMGTFANNHFLGIVGELYQREARMLLTGCYCDYLFKGLPLNRRIRAWDGHETVGPFRHEFYFTRWQFDSPLARAAMQRWEERIPRPLQESDKDAALFQIESLRTFPLCYEGDNQQRLVPQRLLGWSPPVTDLEVLRVYMQTPSRWKLNGRLFRQTARHLLAGSPLLKVPDANTGASLDAPGWIEALSWQWLRLRRKACAWRKSLASDGSWPNWQFYYRHSPTLEAQWSHPAPEMEDLFLRVTGWKTLPRRPAEFPVEQCFLFVALLTLKLWWNHRACCGDLSSS